MAAPSVSTESRIQSFVHALEQGRLAIVIRGFLAVAVIGAIALICLGWKFRGFSEPVAMDQAQIGREIARGHGWSTLFIRPLEIWQNEKNLGTLPKDGENFPDTYNAPLPPLVDAIAIKMAGTKMEFGKGEYIAPAERLIVALSMVLFLASVAVQYFLLRRLFDGRLAFWGSALTLVCDLCWQYTLSGLPQMLMLLLFNLALYALVRAVETNKAIEILTGEALSSTAAGGITLEEAQTAGARTPRVLLWLGLAGVFFGLLTLAHALTIWLVLRRVGLRGREFPAARPGGARHAAGVRGDLHPVAVAHLPRQRQRLRHRALRPLRRPQRLHGFPRTLHLRRVDLRRAVVFLSHQAAKRRPGRTRRPDRRTWATSSPWLFS